MTLHELSEVERTVSATLLRICQRSPFFATLALHAQVKITDDLPTAATDGRDVFVNPEFFSSLPRPAQEGLLMHEVLHAALLHVGRRGMRDPKLWNIACDIVVNGMLIDGGFTLPEGGLRDARKEHLAVEEVYDLLARDAARKGGHTQALEPGMADLLDGPPGAGDRDAQGDAEGAWAQAMEQAKLVAQSSMHGRLPAALRRELEQLAQSRLDWRSLLWRFLAHTPTDFGAFDRRFVSDGLYLETIHGESLTVHVCIDTSGSISRDDMALVIGEVHAILAAYPLLRCNLYFADAALHGPYPLSAGAALPHPVGGGGTDFRPFFARLERTLDPHEISVAVYLTDGHGDFPERAPAIPALWVVTPGGRDLADFPFGEAVRLIGQA
jgi:predicted metal-dependent peptidase